MSDNYKIGPGELDSSDGLFNLSKPEWLTVQCYVVSSIHLPTDQESLRKGLPAEPPGGMDQFDNLLCAYRDLHAHCRYWQDHTFQDSVNCAADIVHYNQKVPSYYGALTKLLPRLEQDPPDEMAANQFKAILNNLSGQAKIYAAHAGMVRQGMKDFAEQTAQDQFTIKSLTDDYEKKLGTESPLIEQLSQQLVTDKNALKKWQDEYHTDVIKAATTPTYGWIWPFGTIAAGIVAGIYGKKATDALKRVHGYQDAIKTLSNELQSAANLMLDLRRICSDLSDISDQLNAAVPIIQKIQGVWTAIHSDVENIMRIIDEDINQVPAIIKSLGIEEAIQAWAKVSREADAYRVNAYINVTTEEEARKAGEKIQKAA